MSYYKQSYKSSCSLFGFLLGVTSVLICLFLRLLSYKNFDLHNLFGELSESRFLYGYFLVIFPAVMACFGFYLGMLRDEIYEQKTSVENLNKVLELRQASLETANEFLSGQAVMDHITGLYNRRHIMSELEKEMDRARRQKCEKPRLHTMMIDVDNFKQYNDLYGHHIGDYVLQEVASIIKRSVRKLDTAGRYSGDEFIVLLPDAAEDTAAMVAQRIQDNLRAHLFEKDGHRLQVTLSIGLASFNSASLSEDMNSFIEKADWSLLESKRAGKNKISIHKVAS